MDELEKIFTQKSQSELLKEEILRLEKELGINQLPSKEDFIQERTKWEKFQIWLKLKTEGQITRERLEAYHFFHVARDVMDGTLMVSDTGHPRRLDEHDTVILYQQKIKHLQALKAKKPSKAKNQKEKKAVVVEEPKPAQETEQEINAPVPPVHEEYQFFFNKRK